MQSSFPLVTLNNGISMPQFGLGVFQMSDGQEVESSVTAALEAGYRLIDTARMYGNEAGVGNAIRASGIPREDIFVTTKLANPDQGYDSTLRAFDASMERLNLDYIDLYLIHWPVPSRGLFPETWKAFEKLWGDGIVRAIGVCNFKPNHLETLLEKAEIVPAVNQIELHPWLQQHETRDFCKKHDIQIESWGPIGGSGGTLLDDERLKPLAEKHGKTPAQVVLRWHIQNGFVVIPKSTHPDRIRENADIFDFALSDEDMTIIESMNKDERHGPDPDVLGS